MKHTDFRKGLPAWIAGILCMLMLCQLPAGAVGTVLDYGRGNDSDVTASASELFEALFGESEAELTSAERQALDALSGVALRYNKSIPDSTIEREYNGELGLLTVQVKRYEYVASNGQTVSWIPTSVSLDGERSATLTGPDEAGVYSCSFSELWHSDEIHLNVDFIWQVEIPVETVNGLLTLPYTVASDALDRLLTYESAHRSYTDAQQAYEAYVAAATKYAEDRQAYTAYTQAKQLYDEKKAAYNAYIIAKAEYDAKVQAYNDYLKKSQAYAEAEKKYYEYEEFRKQYTEIYDEYERYTHELEGALSRLNILESMFVSDSHGWQFYSGVMGSTVDTVLANRDKLELYLIVDPSYIDAASSATEALRPLLKGYAEVRKASYRTKLERYRAEFAYYAEHYEGIRDQMTLLYQSLYAIYSNSGVQSAMNVNSESKEKVPHFRQFLGQLYVLSCALNNSVTLDTNWKLAPNLNITLLQLVEDSILLPDTNQASPDGVTLPDTEVTLPGNGEFPEPVDKPVQDYEVVENPAIKGAPTVVDNPGTAPKAVSNPGDPPTPVLPPTEEEPVPPVLSGAETALAQELREGVLQKRNARSSAQLLTVHQTVSCTRYIDNRKAVSFYDIDGRLLLEVSVEYGSSVREFIPKMTDRSPDAQYTYSFYGWVLLGSNDPYDEFDSVTKDLSLSPVYEKTLRTYEVIWSVNGVRRVENYRFGDTPVCPLDTARSSESAQYIFTGWKSSLSDGLLTELPAVTGNVIYTAQYTELPTQYTVTWIIGDKTEQVQCTKGEIPVCPIHTARTPDDYLYTFLGWDRSILPATEDITYRAEYQATPMGLYNDGTFCHVTYSDTSILLDVTQSAVDFSTASAYAKEKGLNLILRWGSFSVTLTPAKLTALEQSFCTKLEWTQEAGETEEAVLFRIRCLNSFGKELSVSQTLPVRISYTPSDGMYVMAYRANGSKWQEVTLNRYADGNAELTVQAGIRMLFQPEYLLQFSDSSENCNLTAFPSHAPAGKPVELNANCTFGYEISSAVLHLADGTKQTVTASFVMPRGAVSVELQVTRIVYHVSFVANDAVIFEADLFFGDEIPLPKNPVKAEDDLYLYTFTGWTPYVTRATGENRNPVYTASFSRTAKVAEELQPPEKDPFLHVMVPILCVGLAVFTAAVILCICFRRSIGHALVKFGRLLARLCRRAVKAIATKMQKPIPPNEGACPEPVSDPAADIVEPTAPPKAEEALPQNPAKEAEETEEASQLRDKTSQAHDEASE